MRKVFLLSTALTLGTLNPALAGGPVVVEEEEAVVAEAPASSAGGLIPLLLLGAIVAIVVAGGSDSGESAPPEESDIRLKEDITRIGTNHLGLGIYRYRYKGLDAVYEGVMAQEVEVMHPNAIKRLPMGYKAVDYGQLGISRKLVA
jgi:hypothetical protein